MIGNVIATNNHGAGSATAAINFCMFVLVVSWLAAIYGLVTRLRQGLEIPVVMLPLEIAALLFTFIGGIVLAAKLKVTNCGALDPKKLPGDFIAWGSDNDEKRCRELQAATTFLWFLFFAFIGTGFFAYRDSRKGFGGSTLSRPSMSQLRV